MFFSKKSPSSDENVAKKSVKKMDTLVTGVILGGVIASLYGVKKIRERSDKDSQEHQNLIEHAEASPRKKSILKRIIFGNK